MMRGMSYLLAWDWVDVSMDRASSSSFLIMTYHSDSGSSPLRPIISIWRACARESEGSADSYAFLLSCATVHQESSRLLCEGIGAACIIRWDHQRTYHLGGQASAPRPAVTIERRSPWPFDFVDCSFLSRSH
ncbi:hypothetical protein CK203_063797 [Vitis vinifera]|uniref:Uncharacterized protein n=1 Tax=Vitis vinifera TaxID=29760 RepID=A0A438G814_VITVI|nr:hypothetical protein CK203_063797 [Vitis vinifera]